METPLLLLHIRRSLTRLITCVNSHSSPVNSHSPPVNSHALLHIRHNFTRLLTCEFTPTTSELTCLTSRLPRSRPSRYLCEFTLITSEFIPTARELTLSQR
jgi:hypothetical protein